MLTQPTLERLRAMRLMGMAEAFADQLERPDVQGLSFEERFGLLVDHEWTYRQDRRSRGFFARRNSGCPRALKRSTTITLEGWIAAS